MQISAYKALWLYYKSTIAAIAIIALYKYMLQHYLEFISLI